MADETTPLCNHPGEVKQMIPWIWGAGADHPDYQPGETRVRAIGGRVRAAYDH